MLRLGARFEGLLAQHNDQGAAAVCNELRDTTSASPSPPDSCARAVTSWGNVIAQRDWPCASDVTASLDTWPIAFVALTAAPLHEHAVGQMKCHPTTGHDYGLSPVATRREQAASRERSQLSPISEAITPTVALFGSEKTKNRGDPGSLSAAC